LHEQLTTATTAIAGPPPSLTRLPGSIPSSDDKDSGQHVGIDTPPQVIFNILTGKYSVDSLVLSQNL
jgi:hypothetical protein